MNKPLILYTALTRAVDQYNNRHCLDRGHLASLLGFKKESAAIQFSNALNPANHDKTLNDEKKYTLLHTLEHADRIVFFTHYMQQFGLKPTAINTPKITLISLNQLVDDAQMEADESWKTAKLAFRDGTLTREELKEIIKEATEAENKQAEIRVMAQGRLDELGVEG